jgi:hypothetical protein
MSNSSWSYLPSVAYDQTTCVIARTLKPIRTLGTDEDVRGQQGHQAPLQQPGMTYPVLLQPC